MKKPLPTRDFGLQKLIQTKELERRIDIAVKFGRWLHEMDARISSATYMLAMGSQYAMQWDDKRTTYVFRDAEDMWCESFAWALYLHSRIEELKK